jgi:hypothetical protein
MARPTGRPPKPTEQKKRAGNPGKRPINDGGDVVPLRSIEGGSTAPLEVPEPLRPLGRSGSALWHRVWRAGAKWVSADTDIELLQVLCEQIDERAALRVKVLSEPGDWRSRAGLRQLDSAVITSFSLLGFTPADRARMGVGEVKGPESTLDQLRANRGR